MTLDEEDPAALPDISAMPEHRRLKAMLRARLFGRGRAPERIGRFAIRRQIGAGGMGVVYAAHDDELDREVAIKLLHSAMSDSEEAQRRLVREARALARLSHPNVVQVYEVGRHRGQVFVAMELIKGTTLRSWQSRDRRGRREILAMYIHAGRGLAAAHAEGVVHRDFKPENVLVGDDGRARVVDFGLAHGASRAEPAEPASGGRAAITGAVARADLATLDTTPMSPFAQRITRTHAFLGTVAYMAPEQFLGLATDTRCDQFSYCVALHEALCGQRPFAGGDAQTVAAHVIAGDMRPAPSGLPTWLMRAIRRGLAVDPERRFADMNALLSRIGRDRRKRLLLWAGVVTLLCGLGLGVLVARSMADREGRAPCAKVARALESSWNPGRRRAIASAFAASGLAYADRASARVGAALDAYAAAWSGARRQSCVATLVEHGQSEELYDLQMACLDRERHRFDALVDRFEAADAAVVEHAVDAALLLPSLSGCADAALLRRGIEPPGSAEAAARVFALRRRIAEAGALRLAGKYLDALPGAENAVRDARRLGYAPVVAEALYELGDIEVHLGRGESASARLLEAVDLAEASRHDDLAARIWVRLVGAAALVLESPARGEAWFRRARAAIERIGFASDANQAKWALALSHLGLVHHGAAAYDEAEAEQRRALEIRTRLFGDDHLDVARSLDNLGNTLAARGQRPRARELYRRALAIRIRVLGENHPEVAQGRFNIGMLLMEEGALEEAGEHYAAALRVYQQSYGAGSARTAHVLLAMAQLDERRGDLVAALEHATRADRIYAAHRGEDHPDRVKTRNLLATLLFRQERYEEALQHYSIALALVEKHPEPSVLDVAVARQNVGETLGALGRHREAIGHFEAAMATFEKIFGAGHEYLAYPLKGLGQAHVALGDRGRGIAELERALAIHEAHPGNHPEVADISWALARALGRGRRGRALARRARELYDSLGTAFRDRAAAVSRWLDAD